MQQDVKSKQDWPVSSPGENVSLNPTELEWQQLGKILVMKSK